jgi:hypothetical protein
MDSKPTSGGGVPRGAMPGIRSDDARLRRTNRWLIGTVIVLAMALVAVGTWAISDRPGGGETAPTPVPDLTVGDLQGTWMGSLVEPASRHTWSMRLTIAQCAPGEECGTWEAKVQGEMVRCEGTLTYRGIGGRFFLFEETVESGPCAAASPMGIARMPGGAIVVQEFSGGRRTYGALVDEGDYLEILRSGWRSGAAPSTPASMASATSAAEPPASGAPAAVTLQQGNDPPTSTIRIEGLTELTGNRIGDMFELEHHPLPCPPARTDWQYTHVADLGFTWVRLMLDPGEWVRLTRPGQFSKRSRVDPCQDQIVSLLAKSGVTIVLTLVYWDEDLHADRPPDYGREREVRRYLDHVRMLVGHFKDRIRYYAILNEAIAFVDLRDYLDLLRRAIPVIHEEYPGARIVTSATSDILAVPDRRYLFGLLRSDLMPSIGAIATHPMYGTSPAYQESLLLYLRYPSLARRIQDVAEAHGFTGEYLSEEMIWRTSENTLKGESLVYSEIQATKYFLRAIVMHRGLGFWAGIGGRMYDTIPSFVEAAPRLSIVMDGARPASLSVRIETGAERVASYTFSLPNGDRMLALWTNGVAVEEDPGVPATITLPGDPATSALGLDVLAGIQQSLITERSGSDLVIRDLLVKDHPVFVRLSSG